MGVLDKFKDLVGIEEYEEDFAEEEFESVPARVERKRPEGRGGLARRDKVVEMNAASSFKLVINDPAGFDECPHLVDSLKQRKPVILNLEKIDSETAKKIFDFLSGATYALNGNVQKITDNIFVFAPENVDISATMEGKGFDFAGGTDSWR